MKTYKHSSKPNSINDYFVSVKSFGAKGDGRTYDDDAIEAALASYKVVFFPPGNYRIKSEIVLSSDAQIIGAGVPEEVYPTVPSQNWDPNKHTYFTYDGPTKPNVAALRVSAYPVGVEPTGTQLNASNIRMESFGVDCNCKCGIGVYFVRPSGVFKQVQVKGSLEHAFLFLNIGAATFEDFSAYRNQGNGFTLGQNLFGWKSVFADESVFIRPFALFNGERGDFNESEGQANGYGIGIFNSRGLTFVGYESSWNDGPGIWHENSGGGGITFTGGYSEFNAEGAKTASPQRATRHWGLWYQLSANTVHHRNLRVIDVAFRDAVRLTGDAPSRQISSAPIFEGLGYLPEVMADWPNYSLINCNESVVLSGVRPHASIGHYGLGEVFGVVGVGQFNATDGTIAGSRHAGIIGSVSRAYEGRYVIEFKASFLMDPSTYSVILTTGANRLVGVALKESHRVIIDNFETGKGGIRTDSNALINYQIVRFKD